MAILEVIPQTWSGYALVIAAILLVYHLVHISNNLFFHPLSKYAGPRLAAGTDLWYAYQWTSGRWPYIMRALHEQYGEMVRIAPNELSFATVESYNDIYSHASKGSQPFLKAKNYDTGAPVAHIVGVRNPEDHRRQRKALSHAFSTKALREQEDVVVTYVDLFIKQLEKLGANARGVNITEALGWLTFDIIGELTFGESFDAVKTGTTHPWVSAIVDNVREFDLIQLRRDVPLITPLLPFLVPIKKLKEQYEIHHQLTVSKTAKRIENKYKITREDFFKHIIEKGDFTRAGLEANADVLIIAGSETTATALTGTMYYLSRYPECLAKLRHEVRNAFTSSSEITGDATANLPYLSAVVEETLRIYPPVPFGLRRISPGAHIGPYFIPPGTVVSTDPWTVQHSARYWHQPDTFMPERWLGDGFAADNKDASNPFSLGPRGCLGVNLAYLEMRVTLAKVVWELEWEMVGSVDWVRENRAVPLWRKPDLWVRFWRRQGL